MHAPQPRLTVRLAQNDAEIAAAQRLRYRVFVEEMGASASAEEVAEGLERDAFDPHFEHLIMIDEARAAGAPETAVVGTYRVMRGEAARAGIGFYGASEYDLAPLFATGRNLLELGRSCVDPAYRGGLAIQLLWNGLGRYVVHNDIDILFGVASFHGTDPAPLAQPLSYLHKAHLAPEPLRVRAHAANATPMDILPAAEIDKVAALQAIPPLIKSYLRLGGTVGEDAFIDRDFNTVDVCVVIDTAEMPMRARNMFTRGA